MTYTTQRTITSHDTEDVVSHRLRSTVDRGARDGALKRIVVGVLCAAYNAYTAGVLSHEVFKKSKGE